MSFKPPKTDALRHFVVLDAEFVMSGLAALDGGAIDEILTTVSEDTQSQRGAEVAAKVVKAHGGRNKTRQVQEEIRKKRTEHSAAATLVDRLTELEAIGVVDGAFDEDVAGAVEPGMTVRVRGELALHPLHQADAMLKSFVSAAPAFGQQAVAKDLKQVIPMWNAMIGGKDARVLFDLNTVPTQVPRILMPVRPETLQVDVTEVAGFSTIIAKVDRIVAPDEHVLALRMLQNAPTSDLEKTAVDEAAIGLVEAFAEMGIPCSDDDVVMAGPLVLLRPLCAWR